MTLKGVLVLLTILLCTSQMAASEITIFENFADTPQRLRITRDCKPTVKLDRCNTEESSDEKWQWSRINEYHIVALPTKGCTETTISYQWSLTEKGGELVKEFPEFADQANFILHYFTLGTGSYYLHVKMIEKANSSSEEATAKCLITIIDENPEAVITGGGMRIVDSNTDISVQGDNSKNKNFPPWEPATLDYKWSCTANPSNDFCPMESNTQNNIIVPAKYAIDGTQYIFTLTVTADTKSDSATQVIEVRTGSYAVTVSCMKNCEKVVNRNVIIYIQSKCDECDKIQDRTVNWKLSGPSSNQKQVLTDSDTDYNWDKLIIKPEVLYSGETYTLTVTYKQKENLLGLASINLAVSVSPSNGDCSSSTNIGVSLQDEFIFTCKGFQYSKPLSYKVFYTGYDGKEYLYDWDSNSNFKFYLPGIKDWNTKVTIKAFDADGLGNFDSTYVKAKFGDIKIDEIEAIIDGKDTNHLSIETLIQSGKIQKAVQTVHILSQEMRRISNKAKHLDLQFKIVKTLNSADLSTSDVTLAVAGALKTIYQEYNRTFARDVMEFAKKLADKHLDLTKARLEHFTQELRSRLIMEVITDITSMHKNSMRSELQVGNLVFNVAEYFPKINIKVITEDYPNYDDIQLSSLYYDEIINHFIPIVDNMEKANHVVGFSYSVTLAPGELHREYTCSGGNRFKFGTDSGNKFATQIIGFSDTFVLPSDGIAEFKDEPVYAVVIVYALTPYWWLDEQIFQSENTVSQSFFTSSNEWGSLKSHTEQFYITKNKDLEYYKESVTMPPSNEWTEDIVDSQMTVHRVTVQKGDSLMIKFDNLGNNKLRVHLKYNSRPSYKDVQTYTVVSQNSNVITSLFPSDQLRYGDGWLYIAILPEDVGKSLTRAAAINYDVGFLSPTCLYLDKTVHKWNPDSCRVGPKINMKQMHCLCNEQGHYAYQYNPVLVRKDPYYKIPIQMATSINSTIMFLIFAVFACYCSALCLAIISKARRSVYFASDNIITELYGYLIIVKTGDKVKAGTTSNIGIKLFGVKSSSRSHTLNYPDPDKKLLQKGCQDWFVITTETHLGDLVEIYVWHDSVGLEPSWYCDWIRIQDLQLHQEWFFHVQNWFCVVRGDSNYASLKPTDRMPDADTTCNWIKHFLVYYRYYHTWNILKRYEGSDLTYNERITLVLSAIYTTMLFTLIFYGFPKLSLHDTFIRGNFKIFTIIKIAVIASILSFLFHLFFTILFRTKNFNTFQIVGFDLVWLSWVLISIHILVCMAFLIYYGIWVAYMTGIALIISVIIALLQSIILLEGIYILLKLKKSQIPTVAIDSVKVVNEIENQREVLYTTFGNDLLLPYLAQKYRPLTREEWLQRRQKELRREEIARQLYDLIMFLIYILLLYFVVFANRRNLDVYSNMKMKEIISGDFTRDERFEEVATLEDFIEYLNGTLALTTHPAKWYSEFNLIDPGIMIDYCTKILGVVKLRQLRVCKNCCSLVDDMKNMNWSCNPEFESKYSVIGEFQNSWENTKNQTDVSKSIRLFRNNSIDTEDSTTSTITPSSNKPEDDENNNKSKIDIPRLVSIWDYEHEPIPTIGYITHYPGGGYSAPLGRTLYNTYYNIKYLVDSEWIDTKSRVVFVEFLTYNANYNIFNGVTLIFEQSCSGLWAKTYSIYTFRLLFVNFELQTMVSLIFFAFMVMVAFLIHNYLYGISENFLNFWKDVWSYIDLLIIILSITCIILYNQRSKFVETFLSNLAVAQHNEIVFYDNLIYIEQIVNIVATVLICLATVRLWKLLRFGIVFRVMEETLKLSSKPLIALLISHLIIIMMYACAGYIVFGSDFADFRDFIEAVTTLLLLTINLHQDFDFEIVQNSHNNFGYYYYISYMLCSLILIVLYVAIITICYDEATNKYSNLKTYYTVEQYVNDKSGYELEKLRRKIRKVRLSAGEEEEVFEKKVRPKDDEHRYANLVTITSYKLHCMKFIARSMLTNKYKRQKNKSSGSRKHKIDKTVFLMLSRNRAMLKKEMVYFETDANEEVHVVREDRLLKMEQIVDYIINCGTKRNSTEVFFDQVIITNEDESADKDEERRGTLPVEPSGGEFTDRLIFMLDELKSMLIIVDNIRIVELE